MEKEYICGCGKAYGSYPAFSTHRKVKHNNENVSGTLLPALEKARRGRPSYDFKKIKSLSEDNKRHYLGLTTIEFGLLELEEKFKGKIVGSPHEEIVFAMPDLDVQVQDEDRIRISFIVEFLRLLTNHMNQRVADQTTNWIKKFIQFGVKSKSLTETKVYNSFFREFGKQLQQSEVGSQFFIQVFLLLSKWLFVMGESQNSLSRATVA